MRLKARVTGSSSYVTENRSYGSIAGGHGQTVGLATGAQYVLSEGHPVKQLGRTAGNVGGPFVSQKLEHAYGPGPIELSTGTDWLGQQHKMLNCLYPSSPARAAAAWSGTETGTAISSRLGSICPLAISDNNLDASGATAISRCKPTSPVFDGATALAELLADRKLFSVPGRNGSVAGEYLNVQLGALPAMGAIQDFRKAYANSEKLLAQLRRDSGRRVRRQYQFPRTDETVSTKTSGVYPVADVGYSTALVQPGTYQSITTVSTEKWFSGCFTYYLPQEVGFSRSVAELDYLYGIKPGVDTAWELVPFSFVADYFANVGDVLRNLNAFASDGLVMNYGYVMAKSTTTVSEVWTGPVLTNGIWRTIQVASSRILTTMQRRLANPFGFGVLTEDLSLRQLSILAALGISRV